VRPRAQKYFIRRVSRIVQLRASRSDVGRQHPFVGVDIKDPFPANQVQSAIPRIGEIRIPLEMAQPGAEPAGHFDGAIYRTRVNDDDLVCQTLDGFQAAAKMLFLVSND